MEYATGGELFDYIVIITHSSIDRYKIKELKKRKLANSFNRLLEE
jgi:hypothetical protein